MMDPYAALVVQHVFAVALQAAVLSAVIGVALFVLRGQIAPRWRHRLWWVVVIRCAFPVLPTSPVSLYQWMPETFTAQQTSTANTPQPARPALPQTPYHDTSTPHIGNAGDAPPHAQPLASNTDTPAQADRPNAAPHTPEPTAAPTLTPSSTKTRAAAMQHGHLPNESMAQSPGKAGGAWGWAIALAVWLGVGAALALRTVLGWLALQRRLRHDGHPATQRAADLLKHEAHAMGIKSPPALYETRCVQSPTLLGVLRPVLLMPIGLSTTLDDRALSLIFRHELYHQRGHDNLANWLLAMLRAVHWFNPLVWWAFAQLRAQRELARDAQTVQARPADAFKPHPHDDARRYAEALLAVVRFTVAQHAAPSTPCAVTSAAVRDRQHLARRLSMLEHAHRFRLPHTLLACALLMVLVMTGLTVAQDRADAVPAEEQPARDTPATTPEHRENTPGGRATDGSQQAEDEAALAARQIISAAWEDMPFETVLNDLQQQTGLRITFDPVIQDTLDALDPKPNISLNLARVPMEAALTLALEQRLGNPLREALPPVEHFYTLEDGVLHLGLAKVEPQVYDIRDLICPAPAEVTQAPRTDAETAAVRQQYIQQVQDLLRNTIGQPAHWSDAYANTDFGGKIRELNGNLIVITTPSNHRDILALLDRQRKARGWMISYDSQLFLLSSETLVEVFSQDIQILSRGDDGFRAVHPQRIYGQRTIEDPDGSQRVIAPKTPAGFSAISIITQAQRDAFAQRLENSQRHDFVLDLPRVTHFNGRQPWIMIAQHLQYISALESAEDTGELEPTLATTEAGVLLLLESTISADRDYVTLQIELEAAAIAGMPLVLPHEGNIDNGFTEIPQIDRATMNASLSVPKDEWLILVGPLIQGNFNADDPAEYTDSRRVVLLIRPTIIEPAEIEYDEAFPLDAPEAEPDTPEADAE